MQVGYGIDNPQSYAEQDFNAAFGCLERMRLSASSSLNWTRSKITRQLTENSTPCTDRGVGKIRYIPLRARLGGLIIVKNRPQGSGFCGSLCNRHYFNPPADRQSSYPQCSASRIGLGKKCFIDLVNL